MRLPAILEGESLRRLIQGAIFGCVVTAFVGFNWAGWTTESNARLLATKDTSDALVAVLGPMCADKFRSASDATQNMAELKKVRRLGDISRHDLAWARNCSGVCQTIDDVASVLTFFNARRVDAQRYVGWAHFERLSNRG